MGCSCNKSTDMNTSSVFIFGLKSPQPWKDKLGKKEKKKFSSRRAESLGSWESGTHPTLEALWSWLDLGFGVHA